MLVKMTTVKIMLLSLCLWMGAAAVGGAESVKHYTMSGQITAIDQSYNTVVVEVPVSDGQMMTVAGPLVPDATLRKNGRDASLDDFEVGEKVQVQWQKHDSGLEIERLIAAGQN